MSEKIMLSGHDRIKLVFNNKQISGKSFSIWKLTLVYVIHGSKKKQEIGKCLKLNKNKTSISQFVGGAKVPLRAVYTYQKRRKDLK